MTTYPQQPETIIINANQLPEWTEKLVRRVRGLKRGRTYSITLSVPEFGEPVWSVSDSGKIENCQ